MLAIPCSKASSLESRGLLRAQAHCNKENDDVKTTHLKSLSLI